MIHKVLSVCQPWAWLLVNGHKDVENRVWATQYRGPLLIHASLCKSAVWKANHFAGQTRLDATFKKLRALGRPIPAIPGELPSGGIVGRVTVLDCIRLPEAALLPFGHPVLDSPWFVGPVGWHVKDGVPLQFIPLRGRLQIFDYEGKSRLPTYRNP
jgi:hypothetical protein